MQKLLILAALAAAPLGQTAMAQYAPANPTVIVQHMDLDLRSEAGAKTLKHRIRHAVTQVCGTASNFDPEGKNEVQKCRRDTLQRATAQADIVIADAARLPLAMGRIEVRNLDLASDAAFNGVTRATGRP